tara:strand:- start:215 stop:373 length:159 start_codon:yes stop_codon:yes gene_type:complete
MKSPTIEKVDQIASELNINTLVLLVLSYAKFTEESVDSLINKVESQFSELEL